MPAPKEPLPDRPRPPRKANVARPRRSRRELPIHGVWWEQVADDADAAVAAQQAVSVLLNRPQTAGDAPRLREPGSGGLLPEQPLPSPVSFAYGAKGLAQDQGAPVQPPTVFDAERQLPPEAGVISAAFIKRRLAAAAGATAHVDGDAAVTEARKRKKRKEQVSPSLIPLDRGGEGGRKRRLKMFDETTATRELLKELGTPRQVPGLRCKMLVWERERGDGIVVGRMSGSEVQNGETGLGQLRSVLELVAKEGREWRYVVLTLENSGFNDYEQRPDCQFVREVVEAGAATWVAWRSIDRIARHFHPAEEHLQFLERARVDLYLHQIGGKVDWDRDAIQMRALIMAAYVEGKAIFNRTHGAIERRWLEEGRGYPGAKRYATKRDPLTKFLVEDKEQMNVVHWLHNRVASLGDENVSKYGSLRKLSAQLKAELGVSVSHATVGRILRDPIYLPTGEWWVSYGGASPKFYAGRPMRWTNPISYEQYMETQKLLSVRSGARETNSEGQFVLNGILYHAACMHDRTESGKAYKLRAAARRGKTPRYHHNPKAAPQCPRYSISARTIEPVVMRELRRLLETPALEQAWKDAARQQEQQPENGPGDEDVGVLETQKRNVAQAIKDLTASAERSAAAGEFDLKRHDTLMDSFETQLKGIEARIDLARELSAQRELRDSVLPTTSIAELRREASKLLTDEPPVDPRQAVARQALVHSLLSAVVLHDTSDGMKIELQGWLVPPNATVADLPGAEQVADAAIAQASNWPESGEQEGEEDDESMMVRPEQLAAQAMRSEPEDRPEIGARHQPSTPPLRYTRRRHASGFEALPSQVAERPYTIDLPPLPEATRRLAAPYPRRSPLVRLAAVDSWKREWGGRPAFRSPLIPLGRDLRRWQETPEGLEAARAAIRLATAELHEWEPPVGDARYDEIVDVLSDRVSEGSISAPADTPLLLSSRTGRLISSRNVRLVCTAHGVSFKGIAAEAWRERHPDWPVPGRPGELCVPAARAALAAALERLPAGTTSLSGARFDSARASHPELRLPCFGHIADELQKDGLSITTICSELVATASPDGVVKDGAFWTWEACERAVEVVTEELKPTAPLYRIEYDEARPPHYPHSSAILRNARRRGVDFKHVATQAYEKVNRLGSAT